MGSTARGGSPWPTYTPQQLHQVFDRIDLPAKYRYEPGEFSREVIRHRDGVGLLGALQRHMLAHVPFENLDLHYSPYHQVSINADALFTKIVRQRNGRGGYCMENNVFFGIVLRSLGFDVMSVGARVNLQQQPDASIEGQKQQYGGWSHMVNLVNVRGELYMVDVGFGAGGPTHPMPLREGGISMNVAPNENVRLRRDALPEAERRENKLWLLERRVTSDDGPWVAVYCFEDNVCFLPQDFEVMTHFTSTHRTSFFAYRVVASKHLVDPSSETVNGDVVLYEDRVQSTQYGETQVLAELKSEEDRVDALQRYLGITLSDAQRDGIRGMVTEIQSA